MTLSDRVKAEVSLRALAEARGLVWDARKSTPARGDWWAPCPFHGEATASFHVVEKAGAGGWFNCFGCGAKGSVVDFVMGLDGLDAREALKRLADDAGLARDEDPARAAERAARAERAREKAEAEAAKEAARRLAGARAIWRQARGPLGLLRDYLHARGVRLRALDAIPPTLRVHPELRFWAEGQDRKREDPAFVGPAMVAAIGRAGEFAGVHRTWITPEGRARLATGEKVPKKWIGRTGAIFGQPVKFCPTSERMVAGEGIETTLAAWSALLAEGRAGWSAEAALSRGAIVAPEGEGWSPPAGVRRLLILAEGSSKRPEEAQRLYEAAAEKYRAAGLEVALRVPRGRWDLDLDFADLAREELHGTR